ncbi:MAG: fibronectin type III-like domain-contianing protein, partial [Alistipes sp.]|nr:fibronectin type III-like domain-contianing protein [Alistipes sp.]
ETQHLRFELPVAELAFWNRDMKYVVEPGDFQLWVAGDSASGLGHPFTVE